MKMKHLGIIVTAMLCHSFTAHAEMDFVVDFRPATLLLNNASDDFEAVTPSDPALGAPFRDKEDAGQITSMPNIHAGVAVSSDRLYADLTAGVGFLANERFRSPMLGADFSLHYKHRKNVSFGPHIGLWSFTDPEWYGDADVDLDSDVGLIFGFEVAIGYDILFVFSMDYLDATFDASATPPTFIADGGGELDVAGVVMQFGMRGNF